MASKIKHRQVAEGRGPSKNRSETVAAMYMDTKPATFRDRRDRRPHDARNMRRMMQEED